MILSHLVMINTYVQTEAKANKLSRNHSKWWGSGSIKVNISKYRNPNFTNGLFLYEKTAVYCAEINNQIKNK